MAGIYAARVPRHKATAKQYVMFLREFATPVKLILFKLAYLEVLQSDIFG